MAVSRRYSHNKHIALTPDAAVAPDQPLIIGAYAGIALTRVTEEDLAEGVKVTVWLDGSYSLPVTGAVDEGAYVYLVGGELSSSGTAAQSWGIANESSSTSGVSTIEVAPLGRRSIPGDGAADTTALESRVDDLESRINTLESA